MYSTIEMASLVAQRLKRLPPMRETWVRSLGRKDPLEKEMATHSSILAWRIPWTEEPGRLQSTGLQRVGHEWATSPISYLILLNYIFISRIHKWIAFIKYINKDITVIVHCSVCQSCLILCNPMDCSTPGFPILHYLPEFAQNHVHWVNDTIQPSLLLPSPPVFSLS